MSIFRKKLTVSECITPFMVAGVPSARYEGERTHTEYVKTTDDILYKTADALRDKIFFEYDTFEVIGETVKWQIYSDISPTYADGTYTVYERCSVMPIYLLLESAKPQRIKLGVFADRCIVIKNGITVFDNPDIYSRPRERVYVFEHKGKTNVEHVELDLDAGDNRILILTGRVNRSSGFMFTVYLEESESDVYAKIPLSIDENLREKIFLSQKETYLTDDSYTDGEDAVLKIGGEADESYKIEVRHDGCESILPIKDGCVILPEPHRIGNHKVEVIWKIATGEIAAHFRAVFHIVFLRKWWCEKFCAEC